MFDQAADTERARRRRRPRLLFGETESCQANAGTLLLEIREEIGAFTFDCGNVSGHRDHSLSCRMLREPLKSNCALHNRPVTDRYKENSQSDSGWMSPVWVRPAGV